MSRDPSSPIDVHHGRVHGEHSWVGFALLPDGPTNIVTILGSMIAVEDTDDDYKEPAKDGEDFIGQQRTLISELSLRKWIH